MKKIFNNVLSIITVMLFLFSFDYLILQSTIGVEYGFWEYIFHSFIGNWGESVLYENMRVLDIISLQYGVTLKLFFGSFFTSLIMGLLISLFVASNIGKYFNTICSFISYLFISTPVIALAPIIIHLFVINNQWGEMHNLIFPITSLNLILISIFFQYFKLGLSEGLDRPFIAAAYAKGISQKRIFFNYALRDGAGLFFSIIPSTVIQLFSMIMAVECIFDLPGIGRFAVQSAINKDYPVVLAIINLCVIFSLILNMVINYLKKWINPQVIKK